MEWGERERERESAPLCVSEKERGGEFVGLLVSQCRGNISVHLRDRSGQTGVHAVPLREK